MSEATDFPPINMREALIHIDQMQADIRRKQQELDLAPRALRASERGVIVAAFSAGGTLVGATAAITAILIKVWGL